MLIDWKDVSNQSTSYNNRHWMLIDWKDVSNQSISYNNRH